MIKAKAKSLFILPAVAVSVVLFALGVTLALRGGADSLAWWGVALANLPLPLVVLQIMSGKFARVSENAPVAVFVASLGALIAAWEWLMEQVTGWQPLAVASFGLLLLLLYVFWYSRFGRFGSAQLDVGSKLPEFSLVDVDGATVRSSELLGKPAVLMFYRGNWCPLCMAQVNEIAGRYRELEKLGVNVALISSQSDERSRALAARLEVPFRFWVDTGNHVAATLDIAIRHAVPAGTPGGYHTDTAMPTVIVTNSNGTIVFSDQTDNYRVRPEPDVFLAILRRSGAIAR